ncbi:MAG: thioesterase superfamily protein, partial [Nocardioides sp.]|nr:thioesterase superfamily protein [Nocardioides sp.]
MAGYVQDDITPEELERQKAVYVPFTQAVRELVDATIRTEVDDDEIRAVQAEVEALTARLR